MKVFCCKNQWSYGGGLILVAANTKEEAYKETADRMTSGNFMHNRAAIKFSANVIEKVLGLIGLKARKGE